LKYTNIKFPENMSSGSRVVPCGQTDTQADGWTDMKKLIIASHNFGNTLKSGKLSANYSQNFQLKHYE